MESILEVIKQKGVQDGHVSITAGSVQECTYHYVVSTATKPKDVFKTVKGPFEILNGGGIVADGQPHIHITLSAPEKSAFGGHLENRFMMGALGFEVMLGALTTTGSLLAFAKLQGLVRGTPMTYKGQNVFNMALLAVTVGIFIYLIFG